MYPKWKLDPPGEVNFSKISKLWATLGAPPDNHSFGMTKTKVFLQYTTHLSIPAPVCLWKASHIESIVFEMSGKT